MSKNTALYQEHVAAGARMVEFAGWEMPLHYGSQVAEHQAVRDGAGLFDVSHMTVIDISGDDARAFLRRLLAGDVARLKTVGQALYTTLLNGSGGILDDLIVYRLADRYRLVVNAATRDKVLDWLGGQLGVAVTGPQPGPGQGSDEPVATGPAKRLGDGRAMAQAEPGARVHITERDLAILAVQGPRALETFIRASDLPAAAEIQRFNALFVGHWMLARTGYTGEDGIEVVLPNADAPALWRRLLKEGAHPAGLGARDTLRLEAGLNLYGQDMSETTSPLVANLAWTVHWTPNERYFIGRQALEAERAAGIATKLTGLALQVRGVMRAGQKVQTEAGAGTITSGLFSPTLGYSIALARLPAAASGTVDVLIRGKARAARILRPPFVKRGRTG